MSSAACPSGAEKTKRAPSPLSMLAATQRWKPWSSTTRKRRSAKRAVLAASTPGCERSEGIDIGVDTVEFLGKGGHVRVDARPVVGAAGALEPIAHRREAQRSNGLACSLDAVGRVDHVADVRLQDGVHEQGRVLGVVDAESLQDVAFDHRIAGGNLREHR